MKYIAFIMATILFAQYTAAKEDIIESGFKAFKEGGANLAWPAFTKGGPMEGSKEILAQASQFGQIGAYYGKYVNHEYISEKIIGNNNKIIYLILNLESGSLFGRFYLFKKSDGSWVIPNFNFHTHAEQVWPASLYSNCSE
jgi:hypothetical protein